MPIELREDQHELLSADGSLSLLFGTVDTTYLTLVPPVYGSLGDQTGDVERHREDGIAFGEDFIGGDSITFEVGVLTALAADPARAGADSLGTFKQMWRHRGFRDRAAKYAVLRQRIAGRTTRCYGRPRRFEETTGRTTRKGYTPFVATFVVQDARWYDDDARVASVGLRTSNDGGFITPFVFPLDSVEAESGVKEINVGGNTDTWPVVRFHGPCTDPKIDLGPFVIGLDRDVAAGATVTVDPRPWVREATRGDGANFAGDLSWETPPMRRMLLDPGSYAVSYTATDITGTSWCEVEWRDAYSRP